MRLLAATALAALPLAAWAQDALDPLRIDPLTGEPRSAFDPTSDDEAEAAVRACLARGLREGRAAAAVSACGAETEAACREVLALYPLASDECRLEQSLAWTSVRADAGLAAMDVLYARAAEGDPSARGKAEALQAEDTAWRIESGNACLISDDAAYTECRLARETERAALYLDRLTALGGSLGEGR